jgi:hypothetical protein
MLDQFGAGVSVGATLLKGGASVTEGPVSEVPGPGFDVWQAVERIAAIPAEKKNGRTVVYFMAL